MITKTRDETSIGYLAARQLSLTNNGRRVLADCRMQPNRANPPVCASFARYAIKQTRALRFLPAGVAHAPSPDVRYGILPSLTRC